MAILPRSALSPLLVGNTHYVALEGGGEAVIHYGNDQTSHMRLPGGQELTDRRLFLDDGYHVSWQDGPEGAWHIDHTPGRLAYLDQARQTRGEIRRLVPGDPEGFVD